MQANSLKAGEWKNVTVCEKKMAFIIFAMRCCEEKNENISSQIMYSQKKMIESIMKGQRVEGDDGAVKKRIEEMTTEGQQMLCCAFDKCIKMIETKDGYRLSKGKSDVQKACMFESTSEEVESMLEKWKKVRPVQNKREATGDGQNERGGKKPRTSDDGANVQRSGGMEGSGNGDGLESSQGMEFEQRVQLTSFPSVSVQPADNASGSQMPVFIKPLPFSHIGCALRNENGGGGGLAPEANLGSSNIESMDRGGNGQGDEERRPGVNWLAPITAAIWWFLCAVFAIVPFMLCATFHMVSGILSATFKIGSPIRTRRVWKWILFLPCVDVAWHVLYWLLRHEVCDSVMSIVFLFFCLWKGPEGLWEFVFPPRKIPQGYNDLWYTYFQTDQVQSFQTFGEEKGMFGDDSTNAVNVGKAMSIVRTLIKNIQSKNTQGEVVSQKLLSVVSGWSTERQNRFLEDFNRVATKKNTN
jgi:hypothetical protein